MNRTTKIVLAAAVLLLVTGAVFFTPYPIVVVPEWKLRIVDASGQPAVGAGLQQEWIDPDMDGQTLGATQTSDSNGLVVFPERRVHNRLANLKPFSPSAHVYVCWNGQHGQIFWYGPAPLPSVMKLENGPVCPYS